MMTENADRQIGNENALATGVAPAGKVSWLTLKDASDFLGVHFTTLRGWADRGEIPVFRTPGGHRRFSLDDLRRFLAERAKSTPAPSSNALVQAAVDRVRQEMRRSDALVQRWHHPEDTHIDQMRRERGRMLFSLAIAYVMKPQQRDQLLDSAHELGRQYGADAAATGISLVETGRAVQFFRQQLIEAVRANESERPDSDDIRVERLLNRFLDEVLFAVLDGYEAGLVEGGVATVKAGKAAK
jgi:excisionase family DNA binding protein